jgi:hypothetical protein
VKTTTPRHNRRGHQRAQGERDGAAPVKLGPDLRAYKASELGSVIVDEFGDGGARLFVGTAAEPGN